MAIFKITMISMLRVLVIRKKRTAMGPEGENFKKEIANIRSTVAETKNTFDGLVSRLAMAEERISDLEDITTGVCKIEKQRKIRRKNPATNRIFENCGRAV